VQDFNIKAEQASPDEIARLKDPYANSKTVSRIVRRLRRVWPSLGWPVTHFQERRYRFDPDVLNLSSPCYLGGFWQSEKYFLDIAELIRKEFTPRDPTIMEHSRQYVQKIKATSGTVVSLHVRRGELAHAQDKLKNTKGVFGPPTGLEYISQAIKKFDQGSCTFLVFSDSAPDIEWCKQNINANGLHFSEGHTDIQDMMLMSACDHHIIASTFSWWAAWLNPQLGKRVIAPSKWGFANLGMVTDDLIPADWVMI
jgi:hypothetical protein